MLEIEVDLDKKCKRCGNSGVTKNGLCLECITKALRKGEYNPVLEKVKKELQESLILKGGDLVVQKNKTGQMFKCEMRSMIINKEGVKILLIKAPAGVMSTLVDFAGKEVMVTFESPQLSIEYPEDKTSK